MLILGQVRISKSYVCPAGLGGAPQGLKIGKTTPEFIFINPATSILPLITPDPKFLKIH